MWMKIMRETAYNERKPTAVSPAYRVIGHQFLIPLVWNAVPLHNNLGHKIIHNQERCPRLWESRDGLERRGRQADTKDLTSSSKFSACCVLTLQTIPGRHNFPLVIVLWLTFKSLSFVAAGKTWLMKMKKKWRAAKRKELSVSLIQFLSVLVPTDIILGHKIIHNQERCPRLWEWRLEEWNGCKVEEYEWITAVARNWDRIRASIHNFLQIHPQPSPKTGC